MGEARVELAAAVSGQQDDRVEEEALSCSAGQCDGEEGAVAGEQEDDEAQLRLGGH